MGRAYSQDLRERVMAAVDSGAGAYAAASIFRVNVSYIYKLLDRRKRTGERRARVLGQAAPSRSLPPTTKLFAPAS
jgi:transposase